ncbi:MAG TPA: hypothetical protein VFQ39_18305, partial [Longimicrobium sp.]|nr:hypothetical protein [Longimicrobium sp.]
QVLAEVKRHAGWGFLLVTADDVAQSELPAPSDALPTHAAIAERAETASSLALENREAAFLLLWSALEGLLRRLAVRTSLPVERLPTSTLVKHLYTHGELSMDRFDRVMAALEVRNHVAFGYEFRDIDPALHALTSLVDDLLAEDGGE